ncbi:MAG TPA: DUF1549 domain-containing protein, partial [Isosphaeraceae bacterium]
MRFMPRWTGCRISAWVLAALGAGIGAGGARAAGPGSAVDYNRDVRPILSDHCFACHGPDPRARKAKLRLDLKDDAVRDRGGYAAIVPGDVEASELVARIEDGDDATRMPPPDSGKTLTPAQIETLKRWIAQGAPRQEHWAFRAPERPGLLPVRAAHWPRNPIDPFILARLEAEGLTPAPEADRATLLRRVTLDLTGLPPSPAQVDAHLADPAPDAYERAVDRLLGSPRHGEHQARYWLDAARYGDTHGLHLDNTRALWPYRDWVIRAFNANLPYDRFVIEQLAGDLLPDATLGSRVASGFNRAHVTTGEGGSIAEEVDVRNVVDRVETTGTVFLGLTVGCARCHDHKFDPVTMKDFYGLFAFFNSLDANPLDGNVARHPPYIPVPTPEQAAALRELDDRIASARRSLAAEVTRAAYDAAIDAGVPEVVARSDVAWVLGGSKPALGVPMPPGEVRAILALDRVSRSDAQRKRLRDHLIEHSYATTRPTFDRRHAGLAALEGRRRQLDKDIPATLVSQERKEPKPAFLLLRGEYDR